MVDGSVLETLEIPLAPGCRRVGTKAGVYGVLREREDRLGGGAVMSKSVFLALAALLWVGQPLPADAAGIEPAFRELSLKLPTPASVTICHGFGCTYRTEIGLSTGDRAKLAALLARGRASPQAERRAVAAAVAWFDRRIGPQAGTAGRIARAGFLTKTGPGQMDCIDTSRNVTSLLLILHELRLMKHHDVDGPVARGMLVDGRGPHATAVLREVRSGQKWAVDNWTRGYGEAPDVMLLEQWMSER